MKKSLLSLAISGLFSLVSLPVLAAISTTEHDGHPHAGKPTKTMASKAVPVPDNEHNHVHPEPEPEKEKEQEPKHDHAHPEPAKNDDHDDDHSHDPAATATSEDDHEEGVTFTPEQMALANIEVGILEPQVMDNQFYAPGEIKVNGYSSYLVSARVESVIIKRHATLGEHVEAGQPLVTLFSEQVAQAQAAYQNAYTEWQRIKKMSRDTVSDKRYLSTQTEYQATAGQLKAFGLSSAAITAIAKKNGASLGEYTLNAATAGAVLSDDFNQGQRVAPGDEIMVIADEHELWVEAKLAPNKQLKLPMGTMAQVKVDEDTYPARVIQQGHTIDPQTRTRIVRLSVINEDHRLHPGMFTDVYFSFKTEKPVLAVKESALMRGADGDWTVFVEDHPGEFNAVEVELGRSLGQWREISGIPAGSRVVVKGAFFVASQIAKGGFDPHNH